MLYIVATPIGNLAELTRRAERVLNEADVILCEDTRRSLKLLNAYGIKKPLVSYEKFCEREKTEYCVNLLESGKNLALIADAGMPLISDPGATLLSAVIARGLEYTVISGASAFLNALVLSGLDTSRFCMLGFLPPKLKDKKEYLSSFKSLPATLVFYSAPHDVDKDLRFLAAELGGRRAALVREISKIYEQVIRFNLADIPQNLPAKGEMVIVVDKAEKEENPLNALPVEAHVAAYIKSGMKKMDALKAAARDRGLPKSEIYAMTERK